MANKEGVTIIELIVSIVLISIISTIAGLGLINIAKGYVNTKQNVATVQEAQIAMARIVKELGMATSITAITTTNPASISYTRPTSDSNASPVSNTITFSGTTVQINYNGTGNQTLINVTASTLACYSYSLNTATSPTLANTCTVGSGGNIRGVNVTLTANGVTVQNSINLMLNNYY